MKNKQINHAPDQRLPLSSVSEFRLEKSAEQDMIVALAGNPNVGKSTVFNALTGLRQHTGNWPGKTVTCAQGSCTHQEHTLLFVDLPGTYSLSAHSPEEEIAREFICSGQADVVVAVCDATCLERNLNLVLQILSLTPDVILCINLCDEAKKRGITIDFEQLSQLLHIPVVPTCAARKEGLNELKEEILKCGVRNSQISACEAEQTDRETLVARAEELAGAVITCKTPDYRCRDRKIDRILTGRFTGLPVMLCLLMLVFWITLTGANYPSAALSSLFGRLQSELNAAAAYAGLPAWLSGLLIDGVYQVLTWVIAVMLPPMAIFFPLFTLLEDLGYLPRVAYNLDSCFKKCHACGKQALCMCLNIKGYAAIAFFTSFL